MSDQDIHPIIFMETRSICKYYIDSYNALYQLKTEKEEDLNSIYKMIKTELIDSKKYPPDKITGDILNIIEYNNRYTKSYLELIKHIFDDYNVTEVPNIKLALSFLFYKEYGIKLDKTVNFEKIEFNIREIHKENTIYRAIMYNDLEKFIAFTEIDGFNKDQKLISDLYPFISCGYSLLELCCYHGSVDCFKLLRTKFNSEITKICLEFSFLGGNPDIMSECLKYQTPNERCMKNAIISHNIDFVTFLMNEYNIEIDLDYCWVYNNLEAFLVYSDQINDINKVFANSTKFNIPSLCEYYLSHGANINEKDKSGNTPLHWATIYNNTETTELLITNGANINEKNKNGETALLYATINNSKEIAELLISHGANINEKNKDGKTDLHYAAMKNSKETAELLITHGANINEKDKYGNIPLHNATINNSKEIAELLISQGANINEKNNDGKTALHHAAIWNSKETAEVLISNGININEKDNDGKTALHDAAEMYQNKETVEILISRGANINEKDKNGETALHIAAMNSVEETSELLISHGANINEKITMEKQLFIMQQ